MRWSSARARHSVFTTIVFGSTALLAMSVAPAAQGRGVTNTTRPAGGASVSEVQAPVPKIHWVDCKRGSPGNKCAHVQVPLDYDQPNGPRTTLFMRMHPATDQAHKIGSLFVNPGGPGGSAADFAPAAAQLLGGPVRERFDVIGIDPRGIGGSTRVVCKAKPGDPSLPPYPSYFFPRGDKQIKGWFAWDDGVRQLCAKRGNAILDHMSTADTARDMDLIRQAVGDKQLSYYGISYGSVLGTTYAAMFPSKVRAIIVDGVLDPVQWTTGRFDLGRKIDVSARLRSAYGAWEALTSSFSECDRVGVHRCQYAGHIGTEWTKVITKLHAGAVRIQGQRVTYADVIGNILGGLYDESNYPQILDFIDGLYRQLFESSVQGSRTAARAWTAIKAAAARVDRLPSWGPGWSGSGWSGSGSSGDLAIRHWSPTFEGVLCSDSVNPTRVEAALPSAHFANNQGPWFGSAWAWISSICVNWPGSSSDAFQGPWRVKTAHPLLVTGNLHDPATPISGARAVNKLFEGSVLTTVNLWGHGALAHSSCVTSKWDRYLVTGRLPQPGLVCQPDVPLFPR